MHSLTVPIIALLVIFALYRRIRRTVGAQDLIPRRLRARSYIFIVIGILLLFSSYKYPIAYVSDAVGIILGLVLSYFAIKTTQFEHRERGWVYRPNGWIGGIVLALFFARIIYRFYEAYHMMQNGHGTGANAANSMQSNLIGDPWTAGMIFILFSYYPCYFLFLARKARALNTETTAG
jgi:membrane protein CcdC involved in cytochrome C biogenesis